MKKNVLGCIMGAFVLIAIASNSYSIDGDALTSTTTPSAKRIPIYEQVKKYPAVKDGVEKNKTSGKVFFEPLYDAESDAASKNEKFSHKVYRHINNFIVTIKNNFIKLASYVNLF